MTLTMPVAAIRTTPKVAPRASVGLLRAKLLMKCVRCGATHAGRLEYTLVTGLLMPST